MSLMHVCTRRMGNPSLFTVGNRRTGSARHCAPTGAYSCQTVFQFRRITLKGKTIGTVYLESDLEELNQRTRNYLSIVLVVLFASFTQVDASTTRQSGGTGLGLAISKRLVELMGGNIGMESKEAKGSEFWFTAHFTKQPERERVQTAPAKVERTRILVVDDNATNREVLIAQMRSWGARSTAVPDGPTAFRDAVAVRDPFQVAILDVQMPEMDGFEATRRIRNAHTAVLNKDIPIIAMTAHAMTGDAEKCLSRQA